MTCEEFVELVTAYLEGTLTPAQRAAFEEHLEVCPGCDTYLDQIRATIDVLGAVPPESLHGTARQRLLDAFSDWSAGSA
ncbi:MAG: anti-sigma factor [Nocardioidaceae bacterium]|nr:anti-sigma factor [Nocardioidaceae bacterium]NUS49974.1 anti-sigma factor [Nocardioidaceae bacterium]